MGFFNKKELAKIKELETEVVSLNNKLKELGALEYYEIKEKIIESKETYKKLEAKNKDFDDNISQNIKDKKSDLQQIINSIEEKQNELDTVMLDLEMADFGIYLPKYKCMSSDDYKDKIKEVRAFQKDMIKAKNALYYSDNWTLDGNKAKGRAMNNDNMKMYLRAFNNECDVLISKAKFNNIDTIEEKIYKCARALDKLNERNQITLNDNYINLKIKELELVHEHAVKKQEEKEANRQAREEDREHQKMLKEIEEARKSIKKEQSHYEQARDDIMRQLKDADETRKLELQLKLDDINETLGEIDLSLADIDYREANNRAGYVYVISNIGSFGEGVYKIGMTRRLEPQDRVDELGSASVPFRFDVHAMIFSDDAPKLENALHNAFSDKKINIVNGRKEFFKVSIDEIEKVIKENHDKSIEFVKTADAEQYRESVKLRK